jgi:hypothetical protein
MFSTSFEWGAPRNRCHFSGWCAARRRRIPRRQCDQALRLFWEREEEIHRRLVAELLGF